MKMIKEILLLSDPALMPDLKAVLCEVNPKLKVTPIWSLEQLVQRCLSPLKNTRMLSFGSDVIVPVEILQRLTCGAYNFHPGPPTYPGKFPSSFFLCDGGTRFGSTVHEMATKVDSGPIVAVDWFNVAPETDCVTLNVASFRSLRGLFLKLAPHLAKKAHPISCVNEFWNGRTTTQQDFDELCKLPQNVSEDEFMRRYRAVGEGPDHALEIVLHGHRFHLDNQHQAPEVLIGGKKR